MNKLYKNVVNFINNEDGPTAVEYAVMLSLIIVVCLAAVQFIGTSSSDKFNEVGQAISSSSAS